MNFEMIKKLTEANAISMKEKEVRDIVVSESLGEVQYDGLGSVIVRHIGKGPKLMFASHMDEVGFMIRHISPIGLLHVIAIGGVEQRAKSYQRVKITMSNGDAQVGLLQCVLDEHHQVKDMYVDIGVNTKQEVEDIGIQIGDMVTFDSKTEMLNDDIVMAKALDDRIGCYILQEIDKVIYQTTHPNDVYLCYTSSEEVGTKGGKCTSQLINPDIIFIIDVASTPEMIRDYTNHRELGKGYMLVHYDKTMIPNPKLIQYMKNISKEYHIDFQCDMFSGGGTDGTLSHLTNGGKLAIVLGIPLRYCHGSYSMCHQKDVDGLITVIKKLIATLNIETYKQLRVFD
ncbi:MAG: aminopeptidase [Coprobacillaceae bacterium]